MIQFQHDPKVNASYVSPRLEVQTAQTKDLGYGVKVDLDSDGHMVGVEILWDEEDPGTEDWVEDESMTRQRTLDRFNGLDPQVTREHPVIDDKIQEFARAVEKRADELLRLQPNLRNRIQSRMKRKR
jgi:uncharacterized protein YuzE